MIRSTSVVPVRGSPTTNTDWLRLILDEATGAVVWGSGGDDDHDHDRN